MPSTQFWSDPRTTIVSINTQSLNAKYDELLLLLNIAQSQNIRFHVICFQGTRLSETSDDSLVAIDGYNCIHQSKRSDCSNHGGLITYVDNNYEVERINIQNNSPLWDNLFVSIKDTGHNKDIIVGNIYKPLKDNYNIENINAFTTEIENVIHELNRKNSEILIAGDYNINLLNLDMRQAFSDFFTPCYQIAISLESLYPLD